LSRTFSTQPPSPFNWILKTFSGDWNPPLLDRLTGIDAGRIEVAARQR
jgi:hypothetical protein